MSIKFKAATAAVTVAGLGVLSACGGSSEGASGTADEINLVGYSVLEQANTAVIEGFGDSPEGEDVTFKTSYGASGDQSRAVENGLAADVVDLSLEPDMTRLVDAGLVDEDWKSNEHKGIVTNSVVVLASPDARLRRAVAPAQARTQACSTCLRTPSTPSSCSRPRLGGFDAP